MLTLLRRPGLRASSDGVLATKSERKMLASTCSYSLYVWLLLLLMAAVSACLTGVGGWSTIVDKVLLNKFITTSARTSIGDGVGDECDECR